MFRLGSLLSLAALSSACHTSSWGGVSPSTFTPPPGALFASFIQTVIPNIGTFEPSIQFRLIQSANLAIYSTAAMYEPTALDHWARADVSAARRLCSTAPDIALHRQVALGYTFIFAARNFFPEVSHEVDAIFAEWGFDPDRCNAGTCTDVATPWGLAKAFADEALTFSTTDGWNADGSLSRTHNRIPYQDWREYPYIPVNTPWTLRHRKNWQPLLEHNHKGYITFQEHVTPQIGQAGRSIFFTDEEICEMEVPAPHYDLDVEMQLTFDRLAALDDAQKVEIEFFDSKLTSLVPLMLQWYVRSTGGSPDDWEFIQIDSVIISALYESVLVVWKEKLRYDGVRPPSYAHFKFAEDIVTSWGGPFQGTTTLLGRDWEPYIRTMPHAEYPSGSACACAVFESAMKDWSEYDDVTPHIGGPLAYEHLAGSGRVEPGLVPATKLTSLYSSWSEVAARCGQSRLNGGMHFTGSVPHGRELCYDMGTKISQIFKGLAVGTAPDHVVDISAPVPAEVRC